jgi:hypothetical protein
MATHRRHEMGKDVLQEHCSMVRLLELVLHLPVRRETHLFWTHLAFQYSQMSRSMVLM